ncbi:MAG: hypothetical protein WDO74_34825 [Pseudomonadota bacterium]
MSQAISSANVSGFAAELAALLIENDANQAESSRIQRDLARASYLEQAQQQVNELHAAADAMSKGALLSASLTIAGGACQIGAASYQFKADIGPAKGSCLAEVATNKRTASVLGAIGNASSTLADPLKTIIGDSTAERHRAEAKRHETLAAQAQWQASDASTELDRSNRRADKLLDSVQEIQRDNSATNALIGRL